MPVVGEVAQSLAELFSELASILHASESVLDPQPWGVGQDEFRCLLPRPIALESIALFDASVEQTFHFLSRNFSGCFGAETDQLVADGFEKQTQFRAFDDQRINVKQLNVREQASSVFLAEFWIGVFVRVGVSAD